MEEQERLLIELEQRCRSNTHRLDELSDTLGRMQKLVTSVELLANNMQRMADEQIRQGQRLEYLEGRPGREWAALKRAGMTAVVSALAGGVVGALLAAWG